MVPALVGRRYAVRRRQNPSFAVIPVRWIPACAGMTGRGAGMTAALVGRRYAVRRRHNPGFAVIPVR